MEDQIGTVLHWSHQKEPKQAKSKDEIIRRNLDRIRVSTATPAPSNPCRCSQVSLIKNKTRERAIRLQTLTRTCFVWCLCSCVVNFLSRLCTGVLRN